MMCFFRKSLLLQCTCGGKDNKSYTQAIIIILRNGAELTKAGADLTKCHLLEAEMTILGAEVT